MEKEIIIDGEPTGWMVSDEGYTVDTWGRKSYGTHNRTADYMQVRIGGRAYLVHRLVAHAFLPIPSANPDGTPIQGSLQVNHKNENHYDNRMCNLEWCDNAYNNRYGTKNKRQSIMKAKLYRCIETGEVAQPVFFVEKYGLKKQAIRNAANPKDFHTHAGGYHFERMERISV